MTEVDTRHAGSAGDSTGAEVLPWADRLQPFFLIGAIGAGLGLAAVAPDVALSLEPMVAIGVFTMVCLALLGIDLGRVAAAFAERRFLATAITINFVFNPLVAWLLGATFLSDHPDLRVGLILFLVTPCIGWYLVFTDLAGGDVALGVGLLTINLVLQIALLPLYLAAFTGTSAQIDIGDIAMSVVTFLVAPAVVAGVLRRSIARSRASLDDIRSRVDRAHLGSIALVLVIVAMFASQGDTLRDNPGVVFTLVPPLLAFFAVAFLVAMVVGRAVGLPPDQTSLLVFTATSRNSEASLAIAATAFASPLVALTVVIGPIIELPLLVLMVRAVRRRNAPATAPQLTLRSPGEVPS